MPDSRRPCDLVMKGGITSGVAYPAAISALKDDYDFISIGGTSAGAIAAAVSAAAQHNRDGGGFDRLDDMREELRKPGLLIGLFQPTKETRPLLQMLLAVQAKDSLGQRVWTFAGRIARRLALPVLVWVAAGFAALAFLIGHAHGTWSTLSWPAYLMGGLLLVVVMLLAVAGSIIARLWRAVTAYLPSSNYGMCLGLAEGRETDRADGQASGMALTEWLHEKIQHVAGDLTEPLTFADLTSAENNPHPVTLQMMTTDLTWSRPVRLPAGADHAYYFCPDEFSSLFPPDVMQRLYRDNPAVTVPVPGGTRVLHRLPGADLPVLVATRMSLSFPILLAAVPLWAKDEDEPEYRRHWFSDGGISSNFPIHFFDAWVPERPTFGLDLVPSTAGGSPASHVHTYPDKAPHPRAVTITSLLGLLKQIVNTMQNWHDTLQSELSGFHDRIAHIGLSPKEGGLNIAMPEDVLKNVDLKGAEAGRQLTEFNWDRHQLRRYEMFMGMLQDGLVPGPAAGRAGSPRNVHTAWAGGLRARINEYGQEPPPGDERSCSWYQAAGPATDALLADAAVWLGPLTPAEAGAPAPPLRFGPEQPLQPPASMRIAPDV